MKNRFYAVILAGGRGERFWPLSTARKPKQLLSLVGDKPLLAMAVERLKGLIPPGRIYVVTSHDLVAATRKAAPVLPAGNVIGEPVGRDTAAAVALGAGLVKARDSEGVFCVLTADHIIRDLALFRKTLERGMEFAAARDVLITLGIRPKGPSTAYGYIQMGGALARSRGTVIHRVARFVEKPDAASARRYAASGRYCWNSGMFIWSVRSLRRALEKHHPVLAPLIDRAAAAFRAGRLKQVMAREYRSLRRISVDYALMEKAKNIAVIKARFFWDDVGSWTSLENHFAGDRAENIVLGNCEAIHSRDNIVISGDRLTALIGVNSLIVVQAEGVTLICRKDYAQQVKQLVARLKSAGRHNEVL